MKERRSNRNRCASTDLRLGSFAECKIEELTAGRAVVLLVNLAIEPDPAAEW